MCGVSRAIKQLCRWSIHFDIESHLESLTELAVNHSLDSEKQRIEDFLEVLAAAQ